MCGTFVKQTMLVLTPCGSPRESDSGIFTRTILTRNMALGSTPSTATMRSPLLIALWGFWSFQVLAGMSK